MGRICLPVLLIIAAIVFLAGIKWGLPSRAADPYLFGDRKPWTGAEIINLAGGWETRSDVGADVAINPLEHEAGQIVDLNVTDAQRAQIVRRYRLFSYQPDEMVTLRALAGMKPGRLQLDPRLYQYGGLWVYPVGGLLKIASLQKIGFVHLHGDVATYLDHPEQFGRFYIVARFYTVLWALVGVVAIYALMKKLVGGAQFPSLATASFIFMPVVMNMAHEAKPHLPGAVLMLLAVLAGARYVETGARRWWIIAGAVCGAATGMVISSAPIFIILPVIIVLRAMIVAKQAPAPLAAPPAGRVQTASTREATPASQSTRPGLLIARLAGSILIGAVVYFATNPYVAINLVSNRAVLASNLGNTGAMFTAQLSFAGALNGLRWIALGTSPVIAIVGVLGGLALLVRAIRKRADLSAPEISRRATGILLAFPALWVAGQCIEFANGQPGEFGRFAILVDVFLLIEAFAALGTFLPRQWGTVIAIILLLTALIPGVSYLHGFLRDCGPNNNRIQLAQRLSQLQQHGSPMMAVFAEPAPYCLPPVDLWKWKLMLLPKHSTMNDGLRVADVAIRTSDFPPAPGAWPLLTATPMSWANKPFAIEPRQDSAYHPVAPEGAPRSR
ncbi:MAG TPA: glycosyltransferase family 39 protein [Tepidisphaeraceae bacterium]|nr:glycosyltransferase family 39 protein [Tepidisphaeraceae bacterium]